MSQTSRSLSMLRPHWCAALVLALGAAGCDSTAPADELPDGVQPVGYERVVGAGGETVGWVRTERATPDGGTFETYLDPDMQPVGYTTLPGRWHRADGDDLEPLGAADRSQGMAKLYGQRALDLRTEPVTLSELARSGPYGGKLAPSATPATDSKAAPATEPTGEDEAGEDEASEDEAGEDGDEE